MKIQERSKFLKYTNFNSLNKWDWNGIPAMKRRAMMESSLYESVFASLVCHILGFLLIWLIAFLLTFFGIVPKMFPKPTPKMRDIEFVLNDNHRHRVPRVRTHKVSSLDQSAARGEGHHELAPAPKKESSAPKKTNIMKDLSPKSLFKNITQSKPKAVVSKSSKPAASSKPSSKKGISKPSSNSGVKVRSSAKVGSGSKSGSHSSKSGSDSGFPSMSSLRSMSSGLGSGSGRGRHHASGLDSSNTSIDGAGGNGSSSGHGAGGRSGFDKATTRKMISTFDISPYVNELRRNVRWNWKSTKSGKRVDLFVRIARDGRIIILNVKRTSEDGPTDNAALAAVRRCSPLNPLPAKYPKNYLDVIFTFSASSVGSRY